MASQIGMELFQGAKNLDPGHYVGERDLREFHIGITHGPSGATYSRLALPWAGAAYTFVNGDLVKVMGRPGALDGNEMEDTYPNLVSVWSNFADAQSQRDSNPGSFGALVADLQAIAQDLPSVGQMDPEQGEGTSLRARKVRVSQGGRGGGAALTDGGKPVGEE